MNAVARATRLSSQLSRTVPLARVQTRSSSQVARFLYNNVWRKSNVLYISYILAGCVALEVVYGGVTDYMWDSANQGKLFHQIDWTKFKTEDDE